MQRVCFCKTVSLFNHVLQPSQAIALFYQSLIFSLKNLALIRWISSTIDIPTGLQLLMIDLNGNVTVDDDLLYKHLANAKRDVEQRNDTTSVRRVDAKGEEEEEEKHVSLDSQMDQPDRLEISQ